MNKWDKPPQKISDLQHDEHIDEKWHVSYANMMTLLFGLFVILFSISMEKQETFQENLKTLSDSTTGNPITEEKIEATQPSRDYENDLAIEREKVVETERQMQALLTELNTARDKVKETQNLESKIAELEKLMSNSDSKAAILAKESKSTEREINSLQVNDSKNKNLLENQKEEIESLSKHLDETKQEVKKLNDELDLCELKNDGN